MPDPIIDESQESTPQDESQNASSFLSDFDAAGDDSTSTDSFDDWDFNTGVKQISDAQYEEAEAYGLGGEDLLGQNTNVDEELEARQGALDQFGRAVGGGIYKGLNTIVENVGYLGDIPDMFGFEDDFANASTNWLSEWAAENKQEYDEENPIYGDSAWAQTMRGFQGLVDSTVGFAATGAGAGALIGKGAQLLSALTKAGYLTEAAIARVGTAVATNYAESMMMGAELHKNVVANALEKGVDAKEAYAIADRESEEFVRQNKINILTDAFTLRSMAKGQGIIAGAMDKTLKDKIKGGIIDASGEAFEEMSSGFLQKDNERDAKLAMGTIVDDDTSFAGRAADYATSEEGLTEGLMGAIGGPFQHYAMKGTSKLIELPVNAVKKKLGIQTSVNDPGTFDETKPEFTMERSAPAGPRPLTPAERYMKTAANTSREEAESYTTPEQQEAYEKEMKEWYASAENNDQYEKEEAKHEKAVKLWEAKKATHEAEVKKYQEYQQNKKMGKQAQAAMDVNAVLKADNDLRKKYNQAFIDGDKSKMADIENQRFDGLFMRYADRGMVEGLETQLTEIANSTDGDAQQKEFATKYLAKMDQYKKEYMKEFNKHGREKGQSLFRLNRRIDSTKEAINELNQEIDASTLSLSQEVMNSTGKTLSPLQTETLKLQIEQRTLEQIKRKLSINDNSVLRAEFEKREKALADRVKEIENQRVTDKGIKGKAAADIDQYAEITEAMKSTDAYRAFEEKTKQRADAWVAHLGYKKSYEYHSSPAFVKDVQKQNFNYMMDEIQNNVFNDNDVAVSLRLGMELDMTEKDRKIFDAKLDEISDNIKLERRNEVERINTLKARKEALKKSKESIMQSALDARDEITSINRKDYSQYDRDIELARQDMINASKKRYQSLGANMPQNAAEMVNEESVREQQAQEDVKATQRWNDAKAAKVQAIEDDARRVAEANTAILNNKARKVKADRLFDATVSQLESFGVSTASSMEFNSEKFMEKIDKELATATMTNAQPVNNNRKEIPQPVNPNEPGGNPGMDPNWGKKPSQVKKEMEAEAKETGEVKSHSTPYSKRSTKDLQTMLRFKQKSKTREGSAEDTQKLIDIAQMEAELASRKNVGKDGYGEQSPTNEIDTMKQRMNPGSKPTNEQQPPLMGDDSQQPGQPGGPNDASLAGGPNGDIQPPSPTENYEPASMDRPGPAEPMGDNGLDLDKAQIPDFSEPGFEPPNMGELTPAEAQVGAQVVQDNGMDDDQKTLSTALNHLAATKVVEVEPHANANSVTDHSVPENVPAVTEEFNSATTALSEDWPWSVSYVSHSDGVGDANGSGLTDWLETTTDLDKANGDFTIRYEIEQVDGRRDPEDASILEKFKNGEVLNEADVASIPIRMVVYRKSDGKKLKHEGKEVYGWMKTSGYFSDETNSSLVHNDRLSILKALTKGDDVETSISRVSPGKLHSTEGKRENPKNVLKEKKLVIADGISLVDQDKQRVDGLDHAGTVKGFVFIVTKDANGRPFPLKLNSRRLAPNEVSTILTILDNYRKGQDPNDDAVTPHVQGLKNKDIMDLLVYSGNDSLMTEYPFKVNTKAGTLVYGDKKINLSELGKHQQDVANYLASMWRTTNLRMMNKPMTSRITKNFEWFGKSINVTETLYNDFQFNDEALSTNATFPNGRLFVNPAIVAGGSAEWNIIPGKKSTEESKRSMENEANDNLTALLPVLNNMGINHSFNPNSSHYMLEMEYHKDGSLKSSQEFDRATDALRYARELVATKQKAIQMEKAKIAAKSKEKTPDEIVSNEITPMKKKFFRTSLEIKKDAKSKWRVTVDVDGKVYNGKKLVKDQKLINKAHLKSGYIGYTSVRAKNNHTYAVTTDGRIINITKGSKSNGNSIASTTSIGKDVMAKVATTPPAKKKTIKPQDVVPDNVNDEGVGMSPSGVTSLSKGLKSKTKNESAGPDNNVSVEGDEGISQSPSGVVSSTSFAERMGGTSNDSADKKPEVNTDNKPPKKQVRKRRGSGKRGLDKFGAQAPKRSSESKRAEVKTKVDTQAEMAELKKMLPNVPVNIIEGLIGSNTGGVAEGYFYEGVVAISTEGNTGVAFHEGFHAVMDGYLNLEERNNLFNEGRKRFGKTESDSQIEEFLAEEFRDYMASKGSMKVPSTFKWLYDMLLDLVNLFRSNKRSLFSKIRAGRFDYTPPYAHSKTIAYSMLKGNPKMAMVREVVDTLTYRVVNYSGIRSMDSAQGMYENIDEILEDVFDSVCEAQEAAYDAGNYDVYNNLLTITDEDPDKDNWDAYKQLVKDELTSLELEINKEVNEDTIKDEEGVNEQLNIKQALLFSGKDNASNNTKMMVKMIKDPSTTSNYFGPGFEKMANFATSWRILENTLAGLVDTPASTQVEKMMISLESLALSHPEFNELIYQLKEKDQKIVPDYKKVQFFRAFSKQNVLYNHATVSQNDGESTWLIGNADNQSHAKLLHNEWVENFKNDFTDGTVITPAGRAKMQSAVDKGRILQDSIKQSMVDKKLDPRSYRMLSAILGDLGINVSPQSLKALVGVNKAKGEASKFNRVFADKFSYMLFDSRKNRSVSVESMLAQGQNYNEEKTFMTEQNGLLNILATNEGFQQKDTLENMVMGPEGNLYWTKSLNNNVTKTISQWKSDPSMMKSLMSRSYHSDSKWLSYLSGKNLQATFDEEGNVIDDGVETEEGLSKKMASRLDSFEAEVFLSNRIEDGADMGTSYADLNVVDGTIDSLNRTLYGVRNTNLIGSSLSPLTFADKSSSYLFSGIPIEVFGQKEGGASDVAVNAMVRYFYAEAKRISLTNSTNDDGTKKNLTGNSYFDNVGSKEFYWFPELNQGTPTAKAIGLFDSKGNIDFSSGDTMAMVRQHIAESIDGRVEEMRNRLIEQGILKVTQDGQAVSMDGVDSGILDFYNRKYGPEAYNNLVSDYVMNSMVSNIEHTMLFGGDPAFYKDLSKRTPAAIATGIDLINLPGKDGKPGEPTHFGVAVVKDVEKKSSLYDGYLAEFKKRGIKNAEEILSPYLTLEKSDAQGMITPERFRSLKRQLGEWESKHDEAFERLLKGDKDIKPEDLLMMQPLKGMHYEMVDNGTGFLVPTYLKYSQAVLWPGLVKGTPNENLLKQMREDGIDEVIYNSGVKAGATNTSDIESVYAGDTTKGHFNKMTLSNFHWKLQQDLPSKYAKTGRTLVGSQVRKNIKANIADRKFDYKGEKDISGIEMAKRIDAVESKLSTIGRDEFIEKYNIVDGKITNVEPIFEHLEKKFKKDQVDANTLGQLGTPGNRPDLDLMFQYKEKIEQELFAELNKATTKLTTPGGSFIQMSGEGFTGVKSFKGSNLDLNGIIPLGDTSSFKGPRMGEDGTLAADVMIPFRDVAKIPGWDKMSPETLKKKLGDTITDLVGFRIPNQGMSSIDLFNVVGILPPSAGDSMVVYDEITGKTGSDFDIDKMYVMMYNTTWNPKTQKLEKTSSEVHANTKNARDKDFQKEVLENERMNLWSTVLKSKETYVDLVTPLDANWLRDEAYYLELLNSTEQEKDDFVEYLANLKKPIITSFDEYRKLPGKESHAQKYFKQKKGKSLQAASPQEQMDIKMKNMAGKAGVGQTANHLVHHVLMQQVDFAGELNRDGQKITEVISAWLNAYVDNAKDPYISLINNNTFTATAVFHLLRKGVSPHVVNRLMASPVVKAYSEQHFTDQSKIVGNNEEMEKTVKYDVVVKDGYAILKKGKASYGTNTFTTTLSKLGLSPSDKNPTVINTSSILQKSAEELENLILNPTSETNLDLLVLFEGLRKEAGVFNKIVRASKFDTTGAGQSNVENMTNDAMIDDIMVNSPYNTEYMEILGETFMGTMKENSHDLARNIYGDLMYSGGTAVRSAINMINRMIGKKGDNLEINTKIVRDSYSYLYSSAFKNMDTKTMFYGDQSTAHKLRTFKKRYPDNKFLKLLSTDISKNKNEPSYVTFPSSKKKDRTEIDTLWTSWEELIADTTKWEGGQSTSEFARELVDMAFASSGFNKNIHSFFDLIPHTYMRGDFEDHSSTSRNNTIESIKEYSSVADATFIDQFFRHNWNDTNLVPSISYKTTELKNISSKITKKMSGFKLSISDLPSKMNVGSARKPKPATFVTLKGYDRVGRPGNEKSVPFQNLYRLAGFKNGEYFYKRVSKLGSKDKGRIIKEYSHGDMVNSIIHPGAKVNFSKKTFELQTPQIDNSSETKVEFDDVSDSVFRVKGAAFDNFEFSTEETVNSDGSTIYEVVAISKDGSKDLMKFKSHNTPDGAIGIALDSMSELGAEDLLLSLNNACK